MKMGQLYSGIFSTFSRFNKYSCTFIPGSIAFMPTGRRPKVGSLEILMFNSIPQNHLENNALVLGIHYLVPGRAVIAFNDACCSRVPHTLQWTSALGTVSSEMILKTNIKVLSSIEGAIYTCLA